MSIAGCDSLTRVMSKPRSTWTTFLPVATISGSSSICEVKAFIFLYCTIVFMQKAQQENEQGLKITSGLNPHLQLKKRHRKAGMHLENVSEESWKTISPLFLYELPARKLLHHECCPAAHTFPGGTVVGTCWATGGTIHCKPPDILNPVHQRSCTWT